MVDFYRIRSRQGCLAISTIQGAFYTYAWLTRDMGINHGGRDIIMPQQFLHGPDVALVQITILTAEPQRTQRREDIFYLAVRDRQIKSGLSDQNPHLLWPHSRCWRLFSWI